MPRYNYHPEDDDYAEPLAHQPMSRNKRHPVNTKKRPKELSPYGVQRALSEPHRQVVAAAITAALVEYPVRGFKPNLSEMPITLLSTAASTAILLKTSDALYAKSSGAFQDFNDRITEFVDRTNQVRPTVSAKAYTLRSVKLSDTRHKRLNHVAVVSLTGSKGAQTILQEANELSEVLMDPEARRLLPAFDLGFSPSDVATDSFIVAMHQGRLVHNITAALRSDANPEGLLQFGPLETMTP